MDGIEVTVQKFQKVTPKEPIDGFRYYGANVSFKNTTNGPKEVVADAQVRLVNIYVATVNPVPKDIKEGEAVPFGAFRFGTTVSGWIVWAVLESSEFLKSFGVYYQDYAGNEVVWWNNIPKLPLRVTPSRVSHVPNPNSVAAPEHLEYVDAV